MQFYFHANQSDFHKNGFKAHGNSEMAYSPMLNFLCLICFFFSDRTPPQVIITSKPASLSNQGSFTFRFYCQETCSFECAVALQGNTPVYSQCNNRRYPANNLQSGKTYVFGVRGTDDVGNQGNLVTYTWKVGKKRTHGFCFPEKNQSLKNAHIYLNTT